MSSRSLLALAALSVAALACSLSLPPAPASGGSGGNTGGGGLTGGAGHPGTGGTSAGGAGRGGAARVQEALVRAAGGSGGGSTGAGGAGNQRWGTPMTVESGTSPHVAMAGSSAALVWLALDTNWIVKARWYDDGGSWGAPVTLEEPFGGSLPNAAAPKVAMNAHGVAIVTWKQQGNGSLDAALSYHLPPPAPGNGWPESGPEISTAFTFSGAGTADPVVSLGANDRGLWLMGSSSEIRALEYIGIGTSGTGSNVSTSGSTVACPWTSVNARGAGMSAWIEKPPTGPWILTAWFYDPDASQWADTVSLGTGALDTLGCPRVALDDLGRAIATWSVVTAGVSTVVTRTYDPTAGWGTMGATALATGGLPAFNPDVALSATGEGLIVFEQATTASASAPRDLRAVHFQLGRGFDADGPVPIGATAPATSARIAIVGAGMGLAIWAEGGRIRSNSFTGGAWGASAPIDALRISYTSQNPELATDRKGRAIATWESTIGAVPDIQIARFE